MKVSLRHNSSDITYVCLAILFTVFLQFYMPIFLKPGIAQFANVYVIGVLEYSFDLSVPHRFTLEKEDYPSLLEDMVIEINEDKQVRVAEETSRYHICSLQGWIGTAGQPIVCAPNRVVIVIEEGNHNE